MFDLFRRKDTNLRIVLGVLLGLVALSMVVTLIPGFGSGGMAVGAGEETVAKVCGDPVTAKEVRLKLQQMLSKQNLPPESAAVFIPQFIDQYVAVKGVACYAQQSGLIASDNTIALRIQKEIPSLWQDGKFVGRAAYEGLLRQNGLTVAQFEDSVRRDIETQLMRTMVLMSAVATPKEVEDAFRESQEKLKLDYVVLDPAEISKSIKISDTELMTAYEAGKSSFKQPESRNVSLYVVDASRVLAGLQVTEPELRRLYSENIDNYRSPERSKVRHILFGTKDKPEAEDAKMRALAESVQKQLKAGAKFEDLVNKYSDDKGSKATGGDVGFLVRGQTVKNFDEYSFTAPLKTLSGPVKTEFGYHLIEVMERQASAMRSFEEVRPSLEADLRQTKSASSLGQAADQIRAELSKSGSRSSATATSLGIQPVKFEYALPTTPIPGLGPKQELFEMTRGMKKNEVSNVTSLNERLMAILVVDEVIAPRPSTFEEVKGTILGNKLVIDSQKKLEELKAQASSMMNSPGADLNAVAKALSMSVKQTQEFNRSGFADGIGPASVVLPAFDKAAGSLAGPYTVDGKWFFVKVVEKKTADMNEFASKRAELVNTVKNRKAGERSDIFEQTLVKRMIKDGDIKVIEEAKKRVATGFGS